MSDVLSLSQVKVSGTARSKDDAIREAGAILVDAGAVTPDYIDAMRSSRDRPVTWIQCSPPGRPGKRCAAPESAAARAV